MKREFMLIALMTIGAGSNADDSSAGNKGQQAGKANSADNASNAAMVYPDAVMLDVYRIEGSPYSLRASDLIGRDVHNAKGEEIGEIDDLVVSRADKSIQAVLEVGGVMGIGDKLIAMPYGDLRVSRDGEYVFVNATEEQLEARPEFNYNEGETTAMLIHGTAYDLERSKQTADKSGQSGQQQATAQSDTVREIRQSMRQDASLSAAADKLEIMRDGDEVILRGPVRSEEVRDRVLAIAKVHAGSDSVTDEIVVADN